MHLPDRSSRSRCAGSRSWLLALALLGLACAPRYSPFEIDAKLGETLSAARSHLSRQQPVEAEQLIRAVQRIDPDFFGLAELLGSLPPQDGDLYRVTPLGANRARRYPIERPLGTRALLYLPDRLFDFLDVFSVEAHGGGGAFVSAHATHGARLAIGARAIGGLGHYFQRIVIGTRVQGDLALHVLGIGPLRSAGIIAGAGGITNGGGDLGSALRPTDAIYQSYDDYWSVGGSGTIGIGGLSADLHLIQIADFVSGFALVDLGRDDSATTQPIRLRGNERTLLQELAEIEQSPAMLSEYRKRRPELQIPTLR